MEIKIMKRIMSLLIAMMLMCVVFASCEAEEQIEEIEVNLEESRWSILMLEMDAGVLLDTDAAQMLGVEGSMYYEFNGDGTVTYVASYITYEGTYERNDNIVEVSVADQEIEFEIVEGRLVAQMSGHQVTFAQ